MGRHWYEDGKLELFNIREDISEEHNVAGDHPEIAAKLHEQLKVWRRETGAVMPTPK